MENKMRVIAMGFLIFDKAAPLNTASGTHAKMKNLYMSQGLGVSETMFGIRKRNRNVSFRKVLPVFFTKAKVSMKGIPRFKK